MASWKDEYLAALEARDEAEKANLGFYEAYTRIADRSAQLAAAAAKSPASLPDEGQPPPPPVAGRKGTTSKFTPPSDSDVQLRSDLGKAQQERADLQFRLDRATAELEKLKSRTRADSKRINQLSSELSHISLRVRDRDEESRGKAKLLDDVQDEVVTLNLQLNMAEDEVKRLRRENQELVDRWMKSKGEEADKMNEASRF